jgi:predicted nucleotidyltransferase
LDELLARDDPSIRGVILSGSAARGIATEHSDVDVFVVRETEADIQHLHTARSIATNEVPDSLQALEDVSPYRTQG